MNVDKPAPSPHATTIPSAPRRAVVLTIGVLLAVHSVLVMVWVMPTNPFRDAIGQQRLESYINPYFEQSWSVFAPTPRRGGENVKVRAFIGKSGSTDGITTPWYDITADEDQRIKYLINPSRIHSTTRRLGGNLNSLLGTYTAAQREIVAANFVDISRTRIRTMLDAANQLGQTGVVNDGLYLTNEEMLVRFGTMYATARWGDGVTAVQFLVGRRSVPNYSVRNEVDYLDVPFAYYQIGWRTAIPGNAEAQAAFNGYVRKAPATEEGK